MTPVRILVVDDHPVVREGLKSLLSRSEALRVVAEAGDGVEALAKARAVGVDVVLLDWQLPHMDGLEVAKRLRDEQPGVKVVMLTNRLDGDSVKRAIQAGVSGYLLKDVDREEIESAVREAMSGRTTLHPEAQHHLASGMSQGSSVVDALTDRERDVFLQIAQGRSNKEIARELGLTEGTVKGYVSAVLAKTGTADRTQAALLAARLGLA